MGFNRNWIWGCHRRSILPDCVWHSYRVPDLKDSGFAGRRHGRRWTKHEIKAVMVGFQSPAIEEEEVASYDEKVTGSAEKDTARSGGDVSVAGFCGEKMLIAGRCCLARPISRSEKMVDVGRDEGS
ncbi:hypothetical protein ACLOJK_036931 [Asimina triloba]